MKTEMLFGTVRPGERAEVAIARAEMEHAEAVRDGAAARHAQASRAYEGARLDFLQVIGEGLGLEAQWIRAWLSGRTEEANRLCALRFPGSARRQAEETLAVLHGAGHA